MDENYTISARKSYTRSEHMGLKPGRVYKPIEIDDEPKEREYKEDLFMRIRVWN